MAYENSTSKDVNLKLIQEQIQQNNIMLEEFKRWIRYLDEISSMKEYNDKELINKKAKTSGEKYEQLIKSFKLDIDDMRRQFKEMIDILEEENKDLNKMFENVKVKSITLSVGLFNSLVNHNKKEYQLMDSFARKWSSTFGEVTQIIGAVEIGVEKLAESFESKIKSLVNLLKNESEDKEEIFHRFINCIEELEDYLKDSSAQEDLVKKLSGISELFARNYFGSRKIQLELKNNKKIKLAREKGYGEIKEESKDKTKEAKEKVNSFVKDSLLTLFSNEDELKSHIESIYGKKENKNNSTDSDLDKRFNKLKDSVHAIHTNLFGFSPLTELLDQRSWEHEEESILYPPFKEIFVALFKEKENINFDDNTCEYLKELVQEKGGNTSEIQNLINSLKPYLDDMENGRNYKLYAKVLFEHLFRIFSISHF